MNYDIVVLASGNGSTFLALINGCKHANIVGLITDKPNCYAAYRARLAGIACTVLPPHKGEEREAYDLRLAEEIEKYKPQLVVMAGFMRILTGCVINRFLVTNIHPSLLPAYKGLNTYGRALGTDDEEHGTTVHWATEELDGGPIIAQFKVPILPGDTAQILQERTQAVERIFYPEVVDLIAQGKYAAFA